MIKKIQPLSSGVVKKLRSGIALTNISHCVEELVLNSVDAGANCIAVHLNLPFCRIQVIDNGCGIDLEQLKIIGTRYATSKCHTLEDLQNLRCGGFRGEALASLKEVSSILMIESRAASSKETYCKIFTQGKSSDPQKSLNSRPSKGTTVSVYDFMYNMPVRKSTFSDTLDFEDCRKLLQSIALIHPDISFTLKNEVTGDMCMQLRKCKSMYHTFFQIFGQAKANNLKITDHCVDCYEINGYINTNCHVNKDLQFLYVNKRLVLRTKLHKLINNILNKALSTKKMKYDLADSSSPLKSQAQYCIFILNISCPYDKYDIIFEPRKTMVEFSEWEKVLKLVEEAMINFLKKENLFSGTGQTDSSLSKCVSNENTNVPHFDMHDCKQGLFSHVARRLQVCKESDDICDTSDSKNEEGYISDSISNDIGTTDRSENLTVSKCDDKPSVESSSINSKRNLASLNNRSSIICLRNDTSDLSLLDKLKSAKSKKLKSANDNQNLLTTTYPMCHPSYPEYDIPRRTVFPSESPVMMRIPVKSTLSDLPASSSGTDLLIKLKEKFQYSPNKKSILLNENKTNKKSELHQKSNYESKVLPENLHTEQEKNNLKGNRIQSNLKDKSAQCPSVSLNFESLSNNNFKNISNKEGNEKSVLKMQDKSLQCPSVSAEEKSYNISKFHFRKEPLISPLQHLRRSCRHERKILRKDFNENHVITTEDLINNVNNKHEMCRTKKSKLFNDELYSMEISADNVFERNISENLPAPVQDFETEPLKKCYSPDLRRISEAISLDSAVDIHEVSGIKHTQQTNLCQQNLSPFGLYAFAQNSGIHSVSSNNIVNSSENGHFQQMDQLVNKHIISSSKNMSADQKFLYQAHSLTGGFVVINNNDRILQNKQHLSSVESICKLKEFNCTSTAENFPIGKYDQVFSNVNITLRNHYNKMSPCSDIGENTVFNTSFSSNSNSLLNFPVTNPDLFCDRIKHNVVNEPLQVIDFQFKSVNTQPNQSTSDSIPLSVSSSVTNTNETISVKSYMLDSRICLSGDKNVTSEKVPSISYNGLAEANNLKGLFSSDTKQENHSMDTVSCYSNLSCGFSELQNMDLNASTSVPEDNLPSGINLESIPFTENLTALANSPDLEQNNSKEILSSSTSKERCIGHQLDHGLYMESSFSELSKNASLRTDSENIETKASNCIPQKDLPSCINLESIPFTESLPLICDKTALEQHSSKEIFSNIDGTKSSFSELSNEQTKLSSNASEHSKSSDSKANESLCFFNLEKSKVSDENSIPNLNGNSVNINYSSDSSSLEKEDCLSTYLNKDINHDAVMDVHADEKEVKNSEELEHCWKAHPVPETNRIVYIDTKTGNSTYIPPQEKEIINVQNEDSRKDTNVECMLDSWDNPMFNIPYEVSGAGEISQNFPQMYTFLNSYKFSGSTLKSLQVIGQVDCKFIACVFQNYSENCKDQKLFVLFDQHAVHERVRLEELITDLYEVDQNGKKIVKSSAIDPPLKVSFDAEEIRLLCSYHENLHQIGILMNIDPKSQVCEVHSVPLCLVYKESNELRRNRSDSTAILQNSITEWLASLSKTRSIPQVLPRTLSSVLNYQACRGAVKFGDPLNVDQCKALLESLSKCQLPFQCAHGRPSIAPILDLNKVQALYRKRPPPKLKNISMHLQGQFQL